MLSLVLVPRSGVGQQRITESSRRAPAPQWSREEFAGVFFNDAFTEALRGTRPVELAGKRSGSMAAVPTGSGSSAKVAGTIAKGEFRWSTIMAADTIEDEVKALKLSVDVTVTTPREFAVDGYQLARDQFAILALMFGVVHEFDGDVRWKPGARTLRDGFAQIARLCKVGTLPVFQAALRGKNTLQDVLNGNLPQQTAQDVAPNWEGVVARGPLMRRLEVAYEDRLSQWMAVGSGGSSRREKVIHEARITAAIAEVLTRDGMEDSGDDEYLKHCQKMKSCAMEIIQGLEEQDPTVTNRAIGDLYKTCSACHESYRS
jgi:hypothetical protein